MPSFKEQPDFPQVGDRVINLNNLTIHTIPFGLSGTIVGILENKFEVLFDRPFIGGSNLGGKCSSMRGGLLQLKDFFNITRNWNRFLIERNEKLQSWTWDGKILTDYVPIFSDAPIYNKTDISTGENQSPFAISEAELNEKHSEFGVPDEPTNKNDDDGFIEVGK